MRGIRALGCGVAACLLAACSSGTTTTGPSPSPSDLVGRASAAWIIAPGTTPSPDSSAVSVEVYWAACASGDAVQDPRPVLSYTPTEVRLSIWGIPPSGAAFDCMDSTSTTLEVPLPEPLGSRTLVPGAPPTDAFPLPSVGPTP